MEIRVSVDLEYIDKIRDKIDTLEKLLELRDGEIERYREVLKDIGAELEVCCEKVHEPVMFDPYSKPRPVCDEVKITHIYLDRSFACSPYYENELRKINVALEEYGKKKG